MGGVEHGPTLPKNLFVLDPFGIQCVYITIMSRHRYSKQFVMKLFNVFCFVGLINRFFIYLSVGKVNRHAPRNCQALKKGTLPELPKFIHVGDRRLSEKNTT